MQETWNKLTKIEKRLILCQLFFSIVTILAASSQLLKIWTDANLLAVPSVGIVIFLQSIREWKGNRVTSILGFIASLCVFIMFGIGFYLR